MSLTSPFVWVQSSTNEQLSFNWRVAVVGGTAPDLSDPGVVSTSRTQSTLVLRANTLTAGQTYTFTLEATTANGGIAQGAATVAVNSPPNGGAVAVRDGSGNDITQGASLSTLKKTEQSDLNGSTRTLTTHFQLKGTIKNEYIKM
jgi:hypothetical protein